MSYKPKYSDLDRCPNCRSHRIVCLVGSIYDFCTKCVKLWERIPAGEHFTVDGEMMTFAVPCDNCAFRGKSPERGEPERWMELQAQLANGGRFFCHKGVPCDAINTTETGGRDFNFPKKKKSLDIAGTCKPYSAYDESRMRLCRGYLNQHVLPSMTNAK